MNKVKPQLILSEATPNYRKSKIICREHRPCKRIIVCKECCKRKRDYFVIMASEFIRRNGIDAFMTICFSVPTHMESPWDYLSRLNRVVRLFAKLRCKYIRVIAVGQKNRALHVHLVLPLKNAELLREKILNLSFSRKPSVDTRPIDDSFELMGYLYDKNYMPTLKLPDRPKRLRLLTGSRGVRYSYPTKVEWKKFDVFCASQFQENSNHNVKLAVNIAGNGCDLVKTGSGMKVELEECIILK